ncbi:hypothetical protein [Deinococcus sp.]|uniref:hypothetical protein n=1 Tax=Deinococcus sp. TaxID=47478 RepID=UPI003C7AF2D5
MTKQTLSVLGVGFGLLLLTACAPRLASAGISHLRASAVTPTRTLSFDCDPVQPGGSPVYITPDASFSCASSDGTAVLTLLLTPRPTGAQRAAGAASGPDGYFVLTVSGIPPTTYRGTISLSRSSLFNLPGGSEFGGAFHATAPTGAGAAAGSVAIDGEFILKS